MPSTSPTTLTDAEYARRRTALAEALRAHGLRRLVVTSTESIFYLTGATVEPLERPFFLLADSAGQLRILVPLLEAQHILKAAGIEADDVFHYRERPAPRGERWEDALRAELDGEDGIAFEPSTPADRAAVLTELGGQAVELLEGLRVVKSDEEIRALRRSSRYARTGVQRILRSASDGSTVLEGYLAGNSLTRLINREIPDFDPLATKITAAPWPAPLSAEPHAVPSPRTRLHGGPHVALVVARVEGYTAECERTFFTRRPNREQRHYFGLMMAARALAYSLVRPGRHAAEIDEAVTELLTREGIDRPEQRLHRTGHGLGLDNHEGPWLATGSDDVLAENMVISIEPGIYIAGHGGYRHSDTVLVTATGYENLTALPDDLERLTLRRPSPVHALRSWGVRRLAGM